MRRSMSFVLLFSFVLAACGGNGGSSSTAGEPATPQATTQPQALLLWHSYPGNPLDSIRVTFEAEHPEIDLQIEYVDEANLLAEYTQAVNAGAGPDLLLGPASWVLPLAMQGLIKPAGQELLDAASNNLAESVLYATRIDDIPYAIPFAAHFAALYYNRSLLSEPSDIWDDLLTQAQDVGLAVTPTFSATSGLFITPGGLLMSSAGDSQISVSFLKSYLEQLQRLAGMPGISFTSDPSAFVNGEIGLFLGSTTDYPALHAVLADDLGVASLPRIPPPQWSTLISLHVAMQNLNSTAQAVAASKTFILFLLSPDVQGEWFEKTQQVPANTSGLADGDLRVAWTYALEWGRSEPLPVEFGEVMLPLLEQAIQTVILDGADAETVAQDTVEQLETRLP